MNLFFDEESQKLIIEAKKEMMELKHPYVGSEHLMLAILKNNSLEVTKTLNSYGINYDAFKNELISVVGIGSKGNTWFLFTPLLKRIINNATYYSKDKNKIVTPYSLLISILQEGDGVANRVLLGMNIDIIELNSKFSSINTLDDSSIKLLDRIAINMNNSYLDGKYDPVIGRDENIEELIRILLRKNKSNPLLIGEAGVGKTAIVEELARRIALGNVPFKLKNKTIYSISMSTLVSGTKYRGEFEEKLHNIISEIKKNSNIILFIDEIHTLMGAGGAEGAIDAANILKPYLARDDIKIIGATTISEYKKYIEVDKALNRRFQKVYVEEPSKDSIKNILLGLKKIYEDYHNVILDNNIIDKIIDISYNCVFTGNQPDKAIDLLDEVCSYSIVNHDEIDKELSNYELKIKELENKKNNEIVNHNFKKALYYKEKELSARNDYNNKLFSLKEKDNKDIRVVEEDLYKIIYNRYKIPLKSDYTKLLNLEKKLLKKKIYGQDRVINEVIEYLKQYDYISNTSPILFLCMGKTGVGKTYLVNEIIKDIFPNKNIINLNMNDYQEEQSLSKLIGTYPGYVGYNENSMFTHIKENPFSIIVLDNIDRCNNKILKVLFDSFKNGYITLKNEKINISKCIIFMMSNIINDNIGFVNDKNKTTLLSNYYDEINYIIKFNDIDKSIVSLYLDNIDKSTDKSKIINNYDYNKYGLKNIDKYIKIGTYN